MKDHIIKATANGIRVFATVTTDLVEEARTRHNCSPLAIAALGRTMTGALLLAANLKTDESLTIRVSGNGPLKEIVADALANGEVRGYVKNPYIDLPLNNGKLAVGDGVGAGHIYVTRFTNLKQPFTGSTELVTGEIAEDLTNYLMTSEQTPSSVGLGVLVGTNLKIMAAGGFLIQALPDVEESAIDMLEENLKSLAPISQLISEGKDGAGIIAEIFKGMAVNYYDTTAVSFKCQCNKEKIEKVLISLGEAELNHLIAEGKAEVKCHFCSQAYYLNKEELEKLLGEAQ